MDLNLIKRLNMKACFMGLGYIGLPTAIIAAKHGIEVTGVDINPGVVELTNRGKLHIVEPGMEGYLQEVVKNGRLKASLKPEVCEAYFMVVPTPFKGNHEPDTSYVEAATRAVLPLLKEGDLYVIESTSPVGTTDRMKKMISWNVNGLRACVGKGFLDVFHELDADIFCIQESKLQEGQIDLELPGYYQYWSYAEKKGYSGTALFSKEEPLSVSYGLGIEEHDHEGRVITAEYPDYYVVTCYTPNSQNELARLPYRMQWEDDFREYLKALDAQKPVILCGDLNVAHNEIDLKNPKNNRKNAGFSDEERAKMTELLSSGFTDTFRYFYPDAEGIYSWWSYRFRAREKNAGWRIDYFITSKRINDKLKKAAIHTDVLGSDHCPVEVDIEF